MRRNFKRKLKLRKKKRGLGELRKAYEELDRTARTLIRTDFLLHRANEKFDQQISQLHALHRIGSTINSTFDLELILSGISESMTKDLDFEKSGIVFLEKTSQRPQQSAYTGFSNTEYRLFLESFDELLFPALQQEDVYLQTAAYASPPWAR